VCTEPAVTVAGQHRPRLEALARHPEVLVEVDVQELDLAAVAKIDERQVAQAPMEHGWGRRADLHLAGVRHGCSSGVASVRTNRYHRC
jgi:hypothetical protein